MRYQFSGVTFCFPGDVKIHIGSCNHPSLCVEPTFITITQRFKRNEPHSRVCLLFARSRITSDFMLLLFSAEPAAAKIGRPRAQSTTLGEKMKKWRIFRNKACSLINCVGHTKARISHVQREANPAAIKWTCRYLLLIILVGRTPARFHLSSARCEKPAGDLSTASKWLVSVLWLVWAPVQEEVLRN